MICLSLFLNLMIQMVHSKNRKRMKRKITNDYNQNVSLVRQPYK